jgi:hypothetical protein
MREEAQELMNRIWDSREQGVDSEGKLVAFILRSAAEVVRTYSAQDNLIVLDKNNLIELANEVENL